MMRRELLFSLTKKDFELETFRAGVLYFRDVPEQALFRFWPGDADEILTLRKLGAVWYDYPESPASGRFRTAANATVVLVEAVGDVGA